MKRIVLDGSALHSPGQVHAQLAEGLGFPAWYGANLDALHDCLTALPEEACIVLADPAGLDSALGPWAARLRRVLQDCCTENPRLHLEECRPPKEGRRPPAFSSSDLDLKECEGFMIPTPEQAYLLLQEYNQGEFHLKHGRIVGDVLRWYAQQLGYGGQADFWQAVGILHDLDFEQWPDQHCIKEQELLRARGVDERLIHAVASHGWQLTVDIAPEHEMEKVLYAADELTGLIGAVAVMRPSKSVNDLEVKSVKKKYKDKKFAAGCSREVIERGAQLLGWTLDELIERTILAMRASSAVD